MKKQFPLYIFIFFVAAVIGIYLYYQPGWGAMDDAAYLKITRGIEAQPDFHGRVEQFLKDFNSDLAGEKLRPLYAFYALGVYSLFREIPLLAYILNFLILISTFPVWGTLFIKFFKPGEEMAAETKYIYPLTFFLFTPFWNIFMYISLQERFLYFFGTWSLYWLVDSFETQRKRSVFLALASALLSVLGKPTGVFIVVALCGFGLLRLVFVKDEKKLSLLYFCVNAFFVGIYFAIVKGVLKTASYSSRYSDNLNVSGILQNIMNGSVLYRALAVLAVVSLILYLYLAKKKRFSFFAVLLPVCFLSYLFLMAPWGWINYLMGPLAPFILGMMYPIYLLCVRIAKRVRLPYAPLTVILILLFLCVSQIMMPRISKVADIHNVVERILTLKKEDPQSRLFVPPPFIETFDSLEFFTETRMHYLRDARLEGPLLAPNNNFVIFRDEFNSVHLIGVRLGKETYANKTWKIFQVLAAPGHDEKIVITFPQTFFQKIAEALH